MEIIEINYNAQVRTKDNFVGEYRANNAEKIIDALEDHAIVPNDIWATTYDNIGGDCFYGPSGYCTLIVNICHSTDEEMFKAGYAKVISLRKEVIGMEETEYF